MARSKNINIVDIDVEAFNSPITDEMGFLISSREVIRFKWGANVGWGEYTLYKDDKGNWKAESECMDKGINKSFLKALMEKFVEQIEVVE